MAKYEKFEELPVWQESSRLYNRVLDLLDESSALFSSGFRGQLDRAALSVSNNIAEGFERVTSNELQMFIGIARGSAGEVRSMIAVVKERPKLRPVARQLLEIRVLAESCARQLTAWSKALDESGVKGKRHLTPPARAQKEAAQKSSDFRLNFLRSLTPEHPLYKTAEARAARGEKVEEA